jgi:hypothetical protein
VEISSQGKGYTNRPIFLAWFTDIFLSEVAQRDEASGYRGNAVLIIGNCTAHTEPELEEACAESGVVVTPLPSHNSNQIPLPDLSKFGITRRTITRANRKETVNVQSSHIAEVVSGFTSAASRWMFSGRLRVPSWP